MKQYLRTDPSMSCIELQEAYRHIDNYFIRYARNIENLPSDFKKIYIEYANTRLINTITTVEKSHINVDIVPNLSQPVVIFLYI